MTVVSRPLSSVPALASAGLIDDHDVVALAGVAMRYAVAVTPAVVRLIDPSDPQDPLARQFIPSLAELETRDDEAGDPTADAANSPVKGIVHRYPDRALLKVTATCPVYCRFCFRREAVGPELGATLSAEELAAALDYIRATPAIWEVILTGGDPLILSPRRIGELTSALSKIAHVKVLRWHTRMPVAAPERVTADLAAALNSPSQAVYVALHANHPRELTPEARAACGRLISHGIMMVSQTVLLRGVNDDAATLDALMRAFIETRIKPYYLHHLDRAPGTSHFRVPISEGQDLMRRLRGRLSGLAQPTYVMEVPGGHGKMPIGPVHLGARHGGYTVTDYDGTMHSYDECSTRAGAGP